MNIKDVQSNGKRSFILKSGRMLIADAYYLGYSNDVEDEIFKQISKSKRRVVNLQTGVIYSYPEDSLWNVYRTDNGLWIARSGVGGDSIEKRIRKKHPVFSPWIWKADDIAKKDQIETDIEKELKDNGYLFTASTDICTLLVGDQEVFGLDENEFDFSRQLDRQEEMERQRIMKPRINRFTIRSSYNPLPGDPEVVEPPRVNKPLTEADLDYIKSQVEDTASYSRKIAKENHRLVADLEPGEYSCRSKRNGLEVNRI